MWTTLLDNQIVDEGNFSLRKYYINEKIHVLTK